MTFSSEDNTDSDLFPEHIEYFNKRAVKRSDILKKAGVFSATGEEAAEILGRKDPLPGTGIVFRYSNSSPTYYRFRPDKRVNGNRFYSMYGREIPIFIPPCEASTHINAVLVVESATKALSMADNGFKAVGLSGVNTTLLRGETTVNDSWKPTLDANQDFIMLFDSGRRLNAQVALAEAKMSMALEKEGKTVYVANLPEIKVNIK